MFSFFKPKCAICKRKIGSYQNYRMPNGKKVKLCLPCSEYAERRAYKKLH